MCQRMGAVLLAIDVDNYFQNWKIKIFMGFYYIQIWVEVNTASLLPNPPVHGVFLLHIPRYLWVFVLNM